MIKKIFNVLGELKHSLELSKPKLVFVSQYAAKRTIQACKDLKFVEQVVLIGDKKVDGPIILLSEFVKKNQKNNFDVEANVSRRVDIKDQVALIVCSSGTTGLPKGVMVTQENIMSVIQSYRDLFTMMKMIHEKPIVVINIAPWFHALGFLSMCVVACSRDTIFCFLPKFEERSFLKAIEKYKVTAITVVPPIMVFLAKSPIVDEYDLSSVTGEFSFKSSSNQVKKIFDKKNFVFRNWMRCSCTQQ